MCGFLYVNVARRNCPVTLHCVTLLRERALLYKARVRYKSRHSDHKEEFASAQRPQMQKCSPRVHSRANIFAFEKNAEHLQIRRSVIWVESPKSHKRTVREHAVIIRVMRREECGAFADSTQCHLGGITQIPQENRTKCAAFSMSTFLRNNRFVVVMSDYPILFVFGTAFMVFV